MIARIGAFNFAVKFCTCKRKFLRDSATRFSISGFFMNQFPPSPWVSHKDRFEFCTKICGNIFHSSGCTTGTVDTAGKFTADAVDTGGNMLPLSLTPVANLPPVWLTMVANLQRWAYKCFLKSANLKSATSWAQFAIKNPQIFEIYEFKNFKSANFFW